MSLGMNVKLSRSTSPAKTKISFRASALPRFRASINVIKPNSLSQFRPCCHDARALSLLSASVRAFRLSKKLSLQIRTGVPQASAMESDKRRTNHGVF